MASARIHEAIAKEINKEYGMDELLLRIGSVAPDCWRNVEDGTGIKDKYLTHFWDFRIKTGQANDYDEFYFKYYNHLSNPFYFGYLIHLIVDQYWKTNIDHKYRDQENGVEGYRLKDGTFHDDENWFGYFEEVKLQRQLAKKYNLEYLPTEEEYIPNFFSEIDELNLSGLFGPHGTLNYINEELSPTKEDEESLIYDINEIINHIKDTIVFIKRELERLQILKELLDRKYKIAVDIDDTLLSTEELENFYWNIFLQENPQIDREREYKWGDPERAQFWSEYREKMAFGKVKDGAPKCLSALIEKGYIVDLVTARPIDKYAPLKKRIVEYFEENDLKYNHINFGFYEKAKFLKEHGYNLLIDNDLRHIEEARSFGIDAILFGSSNPEYQGYRASSWDEVEAIIEKIFENK